ncbi:MAG: APC family permease [Firmicutes bacterium]|nr:APC family permease [Bacillota bacterium]
MSESQLKANTLSSTDALALSVALLAPVMGVALTTQFAASSAGGATPLSFLLAGIATLSLAYVIIQFTRNLPSAGFAYTYLAAGLTPSVGFMGGWTYAFAFLIGVPMVLGVASLYMTELLRNLFAASPSWIIFFIIFLLAIVVLSAYNIKISTRVQLWTALVSVAAVVVASAVTLAKGGADGISLNAFSPSTSPAGISGIGFGMIFGFTSFIGFEAAAVLGEETANPRQSIPKAILGAVVFAGIFYVLVSFALDMGYGLKHSQVWAASPAPLNYMVTRYVGRVMANVVDFMVVLSAFTAGLGGINLVSRIAFSMGRQRALPLWMGKVHPRYRTPTPAILFIGAVTAVIGILLGIPLGPSEMFGFLASTGSLGIIAVYVSIAVAGVVFFRRTLGRGWSPIKHIIVPLVGVILGLLALYASVYPVPPSPFNLTPYIMLVWIVVGLVVLLVMRRRQPEKVQLLGRVMSEESE